VRDMWKLTLWCKWETCESLHCGASERHVKAYTLVQVRDMWKLTLWFKTSLQVLHLLT